MLAASTVFLPPEVSLFPAEVPLATTTLQGPGGTWSKLGER